jgi:hypothetical protein
MNTARAFPTFRATGRLLRWLWRPTRPVLAVLALLGLAAYVVTNVSAGHDLERELTLIRERGEPLTLAEAAPPPVPDEQNAALVYEQAFRQLPRLEGVPSSAIAGEQQLDRRDEKVLGEFLSEASGERWRDSVEPVRQALAGTEGALVLTRQAAAMARCRFPVDWEAGAGALLPHYPKLRSLTRLLAGHAVVAALDGNPAEAVADLEAIGGMARHIAAEPILIGQMVEYATLSAGCISLQRVMEIAPLDETACRRLDQALTRVDLYASFEQAIQTERCIGLWCFDLWRRDPAQFAAVVGSQEQPLGMVVRSGRMASPLLKQDELFYLRAMAAQVDRASRRERVRTLPSEEEEANVPRYAMVSRIVLPAFSRAYRKRDRMVARLRLAQWALGLHLHRQQMGAYPATLTEIGARLKEALPTDPFGAEFLYRRQGDGYLLYSVGENGRDDNGQTAHPLSDTPDPPRPDVLKEPRPSSPDDIAWQGGD